MACSGLSYIVGVLLVLGITLGAVAVFTAVAGFQSGVLSSLAALDVRRAGESMVVAEFNRYTSDLILYNNGQVPTCILEIRIVGEPSPVYSVPTCTPIPPQQYTTINLGLVSPPQRFTLIARTINNKILTYTIS
ncbi:MAG: hypothetical protein QW173_07950 [Candidatus Caldarchaeum sp.]